MPYHLATPADEIEIISEAFYTVNKFTFPLGFIYNKDI